MSLSPVPQHQFSMLIDSRASPCSTATSLLLELPGAQDISDGRWQVSVKALYLFTIGGPGKPALKGKQDVVLAVQCSDAVGAVVNSHSSPIILTRRMAPTERSIECAESDWCDLRPGHLRIVRLRLVSAQRPNSNRPADEAV